MTVTHWAAAACVTACLASGGASAQVARAGKSELSVSPVFTAGKHYGFPDNAASETESGYGLSVQWHYNFDGHWSAGLDGEYRRADYTGTAAPAAPSATQPFTFESHIQSTTLRLGFDYNFMSSQLTPFVTGGVGVTWVDTHLPAGSALNECVWYPYWGQVCGGAVPTRTLMQLSYNGGFGLRYDLAGEPYFIRALYNSTWVDYGASLGKNVYNQLRIDLGLRF